MFSDENLLMPFEKIVQQEISRTKEACTYLCLFCEFIFVILPKVRENREIRLQRKCFLAPVV